MPPGPEYRDDDPRAVQMPRVLDSAMHLLQHMRDAPALILGCIEGRVEDEGVFDQASLYGSILPAAWSLMIALRTRGIGAAWTTIHLIHEQEAAQLLGIPADITQAVLLPIAYFTGNDLKPAKRLPSEEFTHWNAWGQKR